jgi:hypothetical protein
MARSELQFQRRKVERDAGTEVGSKRWRCREEGAVVRAAVEAVERKEAAWLSREMKMGGATGNRVNRFFITSGKCG